MQFTFDANLLRFEIGSLEVLEARPVDVVLTLGDDAESFTYTVVLEPPNGLPLVTSDLDIVTVDAGGSRRGPPDIQVFGEVRQPTAGDVIVLGLGYEEEAGETPISTEITLRLAGAPLQPIGAYIDLGTTGVGGRAPSPFAPGDPIDLAPFAQAGGQVPRPAPGEQSGGPGDDLFIVDDPATVIVDPGGSDTIRTSVSYALDGPGIETLIGIGTAPIRLTGTGAGEDIVGNAADNVLIGNGGADQVTGGGGADIFVLRGPGRDPSLAVTDFSLDEGDRLAVDDQLLGLGGPRIDIRGITAADGIGLLRDGIVGYSQRTGILTIDTDGDGRIEAQAALGCDLGLGFDDVILF
jgi:hypothetical protein